MKYNRIKLYIIEIILTIILFVALVVSNKVSNILLSLILMLYMILTNCSLKKTKILSTNARYANALVIILGILYIGIFYLIGLWMVGFTKASVTLSLKTLYRFIVPLILIIVSSEYIRLSNLSQDDKIRIFKRNFDLSKIITFINLVLIDLIISTRVYNFFEFNDFMLIIGFVLFSSISNNLFFNYVCEKYGIKGTIIYRIITTIYVYIIPFVPDVFVMFRTFFRMLYPYIMYLILEYAFIKDKLVISHTKRKKDKLSITALIMIMFSITMLISCEFKYGILIVGSGSMKGSLDIGDGVVLKQYKGEMINKGDIIVFEVDGLKFIHRVVDIYNSNGKKRYITKGDANKDVDSWFIVDEDIVGTVVLKIKYIGYPTIWLHSVFK